MFNLRPQKQTTKLYFCFDHRKNMRCPKVYSRCRFANVTSHINRIANPNTWRHLWAPSPEPILLPSRSGTDTGVYGHNGRTCRWIFFYIYTNNMSHNRGLTAHSVCKRVSLTWYNFRTLEILLHYRRRKSHKQVSLSFFLRRLKSRKL